MAKTLISKTPAEDRLFCGVYPTGLVWSDRSQQKDGDYKRLAYQNFETLKLKIEEDCPGDLRALIEAQAADMVSKRGELFPLDACGHSVLLGGGVWVHQKVKIGQLHPNDVFYRRDPRTSLAHGPDYAVNLIDSLDTEVWVLWDIRKGNPYR